MDRKKARNRLQISRLLCDYAVIETDAWSDLLFFAEGTRNPTSLAAGHCLRPALIPTANFLILSLDARISARVYYGVPLWLSFLAPTVAYACSSALQPGRHSASQWGNGPQNASTTSANDLPRGSALARSMLSKRVAR